MALESADCWCSSNRRVLDDCSTELDLQELRRADAGELISCTSHRCHQDPGGGSTALRPRELSPRIDLVTNRIHSPLKETPMVWLGVTMLLFLMYLINLVRWRRRLQRNSLIYFWAFKVDIVNPYCKIISFFLVRGQSALDRRALFGVDQRSMQSKE